MEGKVGKEGNERKSVGEGKGGEGIEDRENKLYPEWEWPPFYCSLEKLSRLALA